MTVLSVHKEELPTRLVPELDFPFDRFNIIQSAIVAGNYHHADANFVQSTSTSTGKTITAELFAAATLAQGKKVIYTSPLKALTFEKYEEWADRFHGKKIALASGDSKKATDAVFDKSDILCFTAEMLDSRTRSKNACDKRWVKKTGLVIVDEAHIMSSDRGAAVECGLIRLSEINPDIRILFLSATMPNTDHFVSWLTALNDKETHLLQSDWRPTKLTWNYIENMTAKDDLANVKQGRISLVSEIVMSKPDEKFLIFVHDKDSGERIKRVILALGEKCEFHNGDLPAQERKRIEDAFKSRRSTSLRVLVATSTLAWGVNTPARNVIICGTVRGREPVDILDIIQMAGRAGRFLIDDEGFVYVISEDPEDVERAVNQQRPVLSKLWSGYNADAHVLAEVCRAGSEGCTYDDILDCWACFCFSYQIYPEVVEEALRETLDRLLKYRHIKDDEGTYSATSQGALVNSFYISPRDAYTWDLNFWRIDQANQWSKSYVVLAALCSAPSLKSWVPSAFQSLKQSYEKKLSEACPSLSKAVNGTTLYMLEHMKGKPSAQSRRLMPDMDRIQSFLTTYAKIRGWSCDEHLSAIFLRLKKGVPADLARFVSLPGVGLEKAKKLKKAGFKAPRELLHKDNWLSAVKILGKSTFNKVKSHIES